MRTTLDYSLWAIAFVFLIVGIDQSVKGLQSYWAFMISLMALFLLNWFKASRNPAPEQNPRENNHTRRENFSSTRNNAQQEKVKKEKIKKRKTQDYTPARKKK